MTGRKQQDIEIYFTKDEGWYWRPRAPGPLPDEPVGPFATVAEAFGDAKPWGVATMTRYERAIERLRTARPKTAQEASAEAGVDFATVNPNLAAIVEEAYLEAWEPGELRRAPRSPWHGPRGRWLTVYATGLAFGGPEEGGWWYTAGARTEYVDVTGKNWREEADRLRAVYAARIDPRGLSPSDSIGGIEIHGPSTYPGAERFPSERQVYS